MATVLATGRIFNKPVVRSIPFPNLPAGNVTPESFLNEQIQTGRQQIQDKYALQWKEVNRSKRFIGAGKTKRLLREIDTKAKQEMLQFNQQAQEQMAQLNNINRLAEQGMISNADEIKARMVFGPDVARSMYPQKKEEDILQIFGKLDVYSHRISEELDRFMEEPPKPPSKLAFITPVTGAISTYRALRDLKKRKVKVWDPNTGDWRKTYATPEEIAEYDFWRQQEKAVAARKKEVAAKFGVSQRVVQPGTKGGTFGDKIAESVRPRQTPVIKSKVIRQRNTRTGEERISYDGGKTWQMSG